MLIVSFLTHLILSVLLLFLLPVSSKTFCMLTGTWLFSFFLPVWKVYCLCLCWALQDLLHSCPMKRDGISRRCDNVADTWCRGGEMRKRAVCQPPEMAGWFGSKHHLNWSDINPWHVRELFIVSTWFAGVFHILNQCIYLVMIHRSN